MERMESSDEKENIEEIISEEKNIVSDDNVVEEENTVVEEKNYIELSLEELIDESNQLVLNEKIFTVSKTMEVVKSIFYKKIGIEKAAHQEKYIADGGIEEDYEFTHPLEIKFKAVYNNFRKKKSEYRTQIENQQENNLVVKHQIIKDIDELTKGTETIKTTFEQFNALQEKWRSIGAAPAKHNNDLWQSYHHHVELFYDFININRDLRDLDFKRNLDKKTEICIKAEALANEKSIKKAHSELQELHNAWKEFGPVDREHREVIWERFKAATHVLNKKRNEHFVELKEKNLVTAKAKSSVCKEIMVLCETPAKDHKDWDTLTKSVSELETKWKSLGRLDKSENAKSWKELREALNSFYTLKNSFYKTKKEESKTVINSKVALCEKVEALEQSKEWKNTTEKIIKIQNEWKKTGFLPKSQSDKLWNRFRTACDAFFNNKKTFFSSLDEEKAANLKDKNSLLAKVKKYKIGDDKKENLEALEGFSKEWRSLGLVAKNKSKIEVEFNELINDFYGKLKINKEELEDLKFQNKVKQLESEGDSFKIDKEKTFLKSKLNELQKQITQYETNIGFFGNSKGAESLKQQVVDKIEVGNNEILKLKNKLKTLNKF